MRKEDIVIVVPFHKNSVAPNEAISLKNLQEVLGDYKIVFCGPEGLEHEKLPIYKSYEFEGFEKKYFSSEEGYNRLLIEPFFYERFKKYEYMLLFQLDVFVFKDELMEWCEKGVDYIGAPWFKNFASWSNGEEFWAVGNGGFSLRKISSFLDVINSDKKVKGFRDILWEKRKVENKNTFSALVNSWKEFNSIENHFEYIRDGFWEHEDIFWCLWVPKYFPEFSIASIEEAVKFSFETDPKYMLGLNNGNLPFGTHAFEKHDPEFWYEYIPGWKEAHNEMKEAVK